MAIRPKVEKDEAELEKARMKIIKQAAPVVVQEEEAKREWTIFSLRIKNRMLEEIEEALEEYEGFSKTGFILQAIRDKLKRSTNE